MAKSVVAGVYEKMVDRESALEMLRTRTAGAAASAGGVPAPATGSTPFQAPGQPAPAAPSAMSGALSGLGGLIFGTTGPRGGKHDGLVDLMAKSAARSAGSAISRGLLRGVLGSLTGKK